MKLYFANFHCKFPLKSYQIDPDSGYEDLFLESRYSKRLLVIIFGINSVVLLDWVVDTVLPETLKIELFEAGKIVNNSFPSGIPERDSKTNCCSTHTILSG